MHSHVSPEICHLHKMSVTVVTVVWFFTSVESHVGLQMMVTGKPFMTLWTFEGLFSGVRSFMVLQNMFVAKRSIADFAGELFVAR